VNVIPFRQWRVWSCLDKDGHNVIRKWLDQNGVSTALRNVLAIEIDIFESNGPDVVPGSIVKVKEFSAFKAVRKGERPVFLLFRCGAPDEREITLLAGTHSERDKDGLAEARRNLVALGLDRRRKTYERVTRTATRRFSG
jgi:hypothetical protein